MRFGNYKSVGIFDSSIPLHILHILHIIHIVHEMFTLTELSVPAADIRDLTRLEFTLNLTVFGLTVQL